MTGKMTRAEFVRRAENAGPLGKTAAERMAGLAVEAGVEWLPVQVDPRVGDLLTEATRLVEDLAVVPLTNNTVWQYAASDDRWYACDVAGSLRTRTLIGARIVFVPGEPVTEQKHETTVYVAAWADHPEWRWKCSCGWTNGYWYSTKSSAQYSADSHVEAARS